MSDPIADYLKAVQSNDQDVSECIERIKVLHARIKTEILESAIVAALHYLDSNAPGKAHEALKDALQAVRSHPDPQLGTIHNETIDIPLP